MAICVSNICVLLVSVLLCLINTNNGQSWQLNTDIDCYTEVSSKSGTCDDCTSHAACDVGYTMTGCSGKTNWGNIDGAYIDGNICYARNGNGGNGAWAYARCCNIHAESCSDPRSSKSGQTDDASTQVSCNSNSELTGCSYVGPWGQTDGSYPGLASNRYKYSLSSTSNTCTAMNGADCCGIYGMFLIHT